MAEKLSKETVLVTGGAGYIGGQTTLCLLDRGIEVVVLDDLSTGRRLDFHDRVHFYEGRVHNRDLVEEIIKRHNVQSIMHFAGSIKVDESISDPLKYYENNTDGSRVLIAAAVECGVKRFVFSSTAAVYGNVNGSEPVTEEQEVHPLNPYGWSKLFTERTLQDVSAVNGLKYGILRYFNVAGADRELRHGQYLDQPVHLIGRAIDAMRGVAPALNIFGDNLPTPDGTGVRDYIHVCDLADAHLAVLGYLEQEKNSLLVNLGYGRGSSVLDVVECIKEVSGKDVPYKFVEARKGEAPAVVASVDKLKSILDWTPSYNDLKTIVSSSLQWMQRLSGNI